MVIFKKILPKKHFSPLTLISNKPPGIRKPSKRLKMVFLYGWGYKLSDKSEIWASGWFLLLTFFHFWSNSGVSCSLARTKPAKNWKLKRSCFEDEDLYSHEYRLINFHNQKRDFRNVIFLLILSRPIITRTDIYVRIYWNISDDFIKKFLSQAKELRVIE